jgi:hypothetical protein
LWRTNQVSRSAFKNPKPKQGSVAKQPEKNHFFDLSVNETGEPRIKAYNNIREKG